MSDLFTMILKLGLAGSYAIIFVMIVRVLLRKSPKIFSYLLWSIVFFRLIIPVSLTTNFSIVPESITYPERFQTIETIPSNSDELVLNFEKNNESSTLDSSIQPQKKQLHTIEVQSAIWGLGVVILWGYSIASFLFLKRKLSSSTKISENIYESDQITTPFVLGILHPVIYLPVDIQTDELDYILLHEQIHIQRKDHFIKPAAFMIVCLHWFNPLVWIAWFSMSKDMEMSCDEAVIQKMGSSIKKEYSLSLLNMASQKNILNASPLAFSDHNAKNRILNVLNYQRPAFWMIALFAVILTFLTLGLSTNKYKSPELKSALQRLAPYIQTEPENIEIISETKKEDITIYKLYKHHDSIENTFFLVFREGNLEDAYFHPSFSQIQGYYCTGKLDQIASKYVEDVYQLDVEFENNLHIGNLYNYGKPSKSIGTVVHFTANLDDQTVSVTISTTNGQVLASSIHQLWDPAWKSAYEQGVEGGYSLLMCDDYVILTNAKQAIEIYPYTCSGNHISFDSYIIDENQEDFSLTINDKEIQFSALTPSIDGGFYEKRLSQRIHADLSTQRDLSWYLSKIVSSYLNTNDKESFLNEKMTMFSSFALKLNDTKKTDLDAQLKTQLSVIDEFTTQHPDARLSTQSTIEENHLIHSYTLHHSAGESAEKSSWTEVNTLVCEDGKFRISHAVTILDEKHWKTVSYSSSEEIAQQFVQSFKYKDLSSIYNMMPYQENAIEQAKEFLQLEIKQPVVELFTTNKNAATAVISFKTATHSTDVMGTTSTLQESHSIQLQMVKTDSGWILKSISY